MPDDGLECFAVRGDVVGIDRRNNHTRIGDLGCVTTVLADDSDHLRTDLLCELQSGDQIRRNVFLQVAATYGKHEERILAVESRSAEPFHEHPRPTFVVRSRREFRHVVGWCVALESCDLAEVVDCVRCVGRASANAEDEQSATSRAELNQLLNTAFALRRIGALRYTCHLRKMLRRIRLFWFRVKHR